MNGRGFRADFEKYWLIYTLVLFLTAAAAYGWRTVALCVVSAAAGQLTALVGGRLRGASVSARGCLIWSMLPLALPPAIPWWVPAVGAGFGEIVARQLFGGYGRNLVNPLAVAVVFVGTGYPALLEQAAMMPGPGPVAGLSSWTCFGPACPLSPGAFTLSHALLADMPVLPGEASFLVALCGLFLLLRARALDGRWPMGTGVGLIVAATVAVGLRGDAGVIAMLQGAGLLPALAAAGLDVYSLPRTPEMRLPAGIVYGMMYVLLRTSGSVVPPAFAALLLVNVLTPLGDTVVIGRRARRWASGEGTAA